MALEINKYNEIVKQLNAFATEIETGKFVLPGFKKLLAEKKINEMTFPELESIIIKHATLKQQDKLIEVYSTVIAKVKARTNLLNNQLDKCNPIKEQLNGFQNAQAFKANEKLNNEGILAALGLLENSLEKLKLTRKQKEEKSFNSSTLSLKNKVERETRIKVERETRIEELNKADIFKQLEFIKLKADQFRDAANQNQEKEVACETGVAGDYTRGKEAASDLHTAMSNLFDWFQESKISKEELIICSKYILDVQVDEKNKLAFENVLATNKLIKKDPRFVAKKELLLSGRDNVAELKEHRGMSQFIVNFLALILTLVVPYLIAAAVVGRFSLFKPATDAAGKVDGLRNAVKKLEVEPKNEKVEETEKNQTLKMK